MLSAQISPNNSLVGTQAKDPTNKSVIEDNFKDNDSMLDLKKRHKHRIIKPSQGGNYHPSSHQDPELDQISSIHLNHLNNHESTKDSTGGNILDPNSALNKLREKTKEQQAAAMKRQRAIIQDMSKNIQKDILSSVSQRKAGVEPVDFG
jgi:hypothetical protein